MEESRQEVAEILRQALTLLQPATRQAPSSGPSTGSSNTIQGRANSSIPTSPAGGFAFGSTPVAAPFRPGSQGNVIADRSAGRPGTSGNRPHGSTTTQSPSTGLTTFRRLREDERSRIFGRMSVSRSTTSSSPRRHVRQLVKRFFGLGSRDEINSPTNARRSALQDVDLGEKLLTIGSSMSSEEIKQVIRTAFKMYENCEFELLKAVGGGPGKMLFLVKSDEAVPNASSINASRSGIIYIRPFSDVCSLCSVDDDIELGTDGGGDMSLEDTDTTVEERSSILSLDSEMEVDRPNLVLVASNLPHSRVEERSSPLTVTGVQNIRDGPPTTGLDDVNAPDDFVTFEQFRDRSLTQNPGTQQIFVQRDGFLEQLLGLYVKDRSFNIYQKPSVIFAGEPARDIGGVTREYFDYGQHQILNGAYAGRHCIFEGQEGRKVPTNDQALLKSGVFKAVGAFIAHSFLHTGKCLYGLSDVVVRYLCSDDDFDDSTLVITPDDVPCYDTRLILSKINDWNIDCPLTENHIFLIREAAISSGFMADITLSNKQLLTECILMHNVVHLRKPQLDAMKDALKKTSFHNYIKNKPYMFEFAFPPISQRTYTPAMLLANLRFNGDHDERVKTLFETYVSNLDSITITEFLKCVTAWSYMPTEPIIIDVGDHPYIHFATCYQTIDIPSEMSNQEILDNLVNAVSNGSVGFGGI